jgi:Zn-dependent protease with chaperone function
MAAPLSAGERVSFHDEQARRRRGTWRLGAACLAIASTMGLVTAAIAGPFVMLSLGGILNLIATLGIFPQAAQGAAIGIGLWAADKLDLLGLVTDNLDRLETWHDHTVMFGRLADLLPAFLPGLALSALLWIGFQRLARRDGAEDLAEALRARPPRPADLEEKQLSNIVEEVAIAAGLPAPRVLLVDSPAVNAAAIGTSHDHATLLVTRGLLDTLNRDETVGIVGHLVGSVGNGDLAVMRSLVAVFQVKGFFLTILDLPFRWSAWKALASLGTVVVHPNPTSAKVAEALHAVEAGLSTDATEEINRNLSEGRFKTLKLVLMFPLLLVMLIAIMQKLIIQLWTLFFLGWPLAALWRTRRYLADSTAVQLTRNPEALESALGKLGSIPEGGEARDYLFVHAAGHDAGLNAKGFSARRGIADSIQPSLAARVGRMKAQGSGLVGWANRITPGRALGYGVLSLILGPLVGVILVLVAMLTAGTIVASLSFGLVVTAALLT